MQFGAVGAVYAWDRVADLITTILSTLLLLPLSRFCRRHILLRPQGRGYFVLTWDLSNRGCASLGPGLFQHCRCPFERMSTSLWTRDPVAVSQKMSVLRFTSLSSFLCPLGVFSEDQKSTLIKATRDRAVLLLEIHEFVFQHHMSFGSETVRHIKDLQAEISVECPGEVQDERKFTYELSKKGTFDDRVVSSLPSCMHWLTWIATGSPVTSERVAESLNFVFEEQKHVQRLQQKGLRVHTFRDRCRSSGVPNLQVPVNQDKSSETPLASRPYMRPRDRIKSLRYTKLSDGEVRERCLAHWEYIGVLEAEVRIRLQLMSIPGSWTCVRAALMSYGMYMNIQHPHSQHFPVSLRSFGSYCCMFDNAGTLSQYMAAVGKSHSIQGLPFVSLAEQSALKKGSRKFQPKSERSFVTHDQVASLRLHASSRGREDLSRFMSVSYPYQGRVQSEIVPWNQSGDNASPRLPRSGTPLSDFILKQQKLS